MAGVGMGVPRAQHYAFAPKPSRETRTEPGRKGHRWAAAILGAASPYLVTLPICNRPQA